MPPFCPCAQVLEMVERLDEAVRTELTTLEEVLTQRTELVAAARGARRQAETVAQQLQGLAFWRGVPLSPLPKQNPGPRLPGSLVHQLPLPTWLNLRVPKEMPSNLQLRMNPQLPWERAQHRGGGNKEGPSLLKSPKRLKMNSKCPDGAPLILASSSGSEEV